MLKIDQAHKHYYEECKRVDFWRTAAAGRFGEVFFKVLGDKNDTLIESDKWLQRWDKESPYAFTRRAKSVQDPDYSKKIITFFSGSFARASQSLSITARPQVKADELAEMIKDDCDNRGSTMSQYVVAILEDLIISGRTWIVGDAMQPQRDGEGVRPYLSMIRREDVLQYNEGSDGKLNYLKYKRCYHEVRGIEVVEFDRIFIWTLDEWYIYSKEHKDNNWTLERQEPNTLGMIPAAHIDLGKDAISLIDNPAKFQLTMMNVSSEMRNALSLQCLILLCLPESTIQMLSDASQDGSQKKQKIKLSVNTIIPFSDTATGMPFYLSPNVGALDSQFKMLDWLKTTLFTSSSVYAAKTAAESGESKRFEFTQSLAVLSFVADRIQEAITVVIDSLATAYGLSDVTVAYQIGREFEPMDAKAFLENVMAADAVGIGATAMDKLRKKTRDQFGLKFTPDEQAQSDLEISELSSFQGEQGEVEDSPTDK